MGDRIYFGVLGLIIAVSLSFAVVAEPVVHENDEPSIDLIVPSDGSLPSAKGGVVFIEQGDSFDVYVQLGEPDEIRATVEFGPLNQGAVVLDEPVIWTQTVTVDAEEAVTVNLWNYDESVPHELLADFEVIRIMIDDERISEVPVFSVSEGSWELVITYQTPALRRETSCSMRTVADLIPPGATLIESDLPLDTMLGEVCRTRYIHEGHMPYEGVEYLFDSE